MNKLMQRLNNNDLFFFSVFLIFAVVIVIEKDMVDVVFFVCTLLLYLKYKLFNEIILMCNFFIGGI